MDCLLTENCDCSLGHGSLLVLHFEIDQFMENFLGCFHLSSKKENAQGIVKHRQREANTSVLDISVDREIKPRKSQQDYAPKSEKKECGRKKTKSDEDDASSRRGFNFPCHEWEKRVPSRYGS
jgi:hypothetical protein